MAALNPAKPSPTVLRWLVRGWGNQGFSGDVSYLLQVWKEALKARCILECGSGISTLVLGAVARKTSAEVYSLEHSKEWWTRVNDSLATRHFPNRVTYAPMQRYDDYDWYSIPRELPSHFDLVICDGPPSATRGGRYGLLPVCFERLQRTTILMDDAERGDEQEIIRRWQCEFPIDCRTIEGAQGSFAVIRLGRERNTSR